MRTLASANMLARTFHYILVLQSLVRQGEVEMIAINGKDNVSDKLTKGYESNPQLEHTNEFFAV
jgi:hypothetical protein